MTPKDHAQVWRDVAHVFNDDIEKTTDQGARAWMAFASYAAHVIAGRYSEAETRRAECITLVKK